MTRLNFAMKPSYDRTGCSSQGFEATPSVSASAPYFRQLDGLRAICILFTVVNHVDRHPDYLNGSVGVDVFFALSGFLITNLLLGEARSDGRPCLQCFYIRRLFRIVPLYYIVFALYVGAAFVLHGAGRGADIYSSMQNAWPSVVTFMSEYRPAEAGTFFGHAWTLGIEEKYYLLWPLLFIGLRSLRYSLQVTLLVAAFCAELLLLSHLEMRGYGGLTIGSLVAIVANNNSSLIAKLCSAPGAWALAMLAAYIAVVVSGDARFNILMSTTAALMIASVVRHESGVVARVLSWKPLAAAGKLTYGVYLIHVLVANAVATALTAMDVRYSWLLAFVLTYALSLAAAVGLKVAIEDPMIALGRRFATRFAAVRRSPVPAISLHPQRLRYVPLMGAHT